jgi:hypothetical protein
MLVLRDYELRARKAVSREPPALSKTAQSSQLAEDPGNVSVRPGSCRQPKNDCQKER